ncbi:unnamed protein product, partial [Laminaria digitata]
MRHTNSNNTNSSNNGRRSSLLVTALLSSVAAASRSYTCHHHPRQPAAALGAPTAAVVAAVAVAAIVAKHDDDNGDDNDNELVACLTDGLAAPPSHQPGVTASHENIQRLPMPTKGSGIRVAKPTVGSEMRATKPLTGSELRATMPIMASEIRATTPILASEIRVTMPLCSSSSSSSSRCGAGLMAARVARGGCTEQSRRLLPGRARRRRRPLQRFVAPALVWVFAAVVDYDLWWKLGFTTAAPAIDEDASTHPFGSVIAGGAGAAAIAVNRAHFVCFHVLLVLALLSHVAVTFADPGFCPPREASCLAEEKTRQSGRWCGHCQMFKPPRAHHCRRCGGCVARMDHHCIYAANCVGAGNHKQFVLLLLYSGACAAHANLLYFRVLGRGLVDGLLLPVLAVAVLSWLVAILSVHLYGVAVDAGTVDRMQAASAGRSAEEAAAAAAAAAAGSAGSGPAAERGRRLLLYRGRTVPSLRGLPMPSNRLNSGGACASAPSATGESARSAAFPPARRREGGVQGVADYSRGPLGRAAVTAAAVVDANGEECRGMREAPSLRSSFCDRWRTLREEVLGDGPWVMWFVPSPAKLSPEVRERVFAP